MTTQIEREIQGLSALAHDQARIVHARLDTLLKQPRAWSPAELHELIRGARNFLVTLEDLADLLAELS